MHPPRIALQADEADQVAEGCFFFDGLSGMIDNKWQASACPLHSIAESGAGLVLFSMFNCKLCWVVSTRPSIWKILDNIRTIAVSTINIRRYKRSGRYGPAIPMLLLFTLIFLQVLDGFNQERSAICHKLQPTSPLASICLFVGQS